MQYLVLISSLVAFCNEAVAGNSHGDGENAFIEAHPYQVSILTKNSSELKPVHICSGSILNNITVLTSAFCVMDITSTALSVRAGSSFQTNGGTTIDVLDILHHPKYKHFALDYDVAIVKLKNAFNFSDEIKSIDIQPFHPIFKDGTSATVTGWGQLWSALDYNPKPRHLQKVDVKKVAHDQCISAYNFVTVNVTSRMVCYSASCQPDAGGPLVVGKLQVGISSWEISCANKSFPGVYTNIQNPEIHNFIHSHL